MSEKAFLHNKWIEYYIMLVDKYSDNSISREKHEKLSNKLSEWEAEYGRIKRNQQA